MQQPKLSGCLVGPEGSVSLGFPCLGETDPRIPLGCKVREEKNLCPV